jgi:SOS response regulatory protein OraA/RecX
LELKQKGIDDGIIEEVLTYYVDENSEMEMAKRVLKKVGKRYSGMEERIKRDKIVKYLLGKGFSYSIVEKIL